MDKKKMNTDEVDELLNSMKLEDLDFDGVETYSIETSHNKRMMHYFLRVTAVAVIALILVVLYQPKEQINYQLSEAEAEAYLKSVLLENMDDFDTTQFYFLSQEPSFEIMPLEPADFYFFDDVDEVDA